MIVKLFGFIRLTAFFLLLFSYSSYAIAPGTLFNLVAGNTRGGCDDQLLNLATWLDESVTLGEAGLEGIQVARGTRAVENNGFKNQLMTAKLAYSFFRLDSSSSKEDWDMVQTRFQRVLNWVTRQAANPGGAKPWLFCGTHYITRQESTDIALDSAGQPLEGNPTIQDEYADKLAGGKTPWWSESNHRYYFGGEDDDNTCDFDLMLPAATDTSDPPPYITFLCTDNIHGPFIVNQETLGSVTPRDGTSFYSVRPKSINIFHELFHLIIGNDYTHDATYVLGGIENAVTNPDTKPEKRTISTDANDIETADPNTAGETNLQLLRNNPETYALFAVAYWHWTQTYPTGPDGNDRKALFPADFVVQMIDWDANVK